MMIQILAAKERKERKRWRGVVRGIDFSIIASQRISQNTFHFPPRTLDLRFSNSANSVCEIQNLPSFASFMLFRGNAQFSAAKERREHKKDCRFGRSFNFVHAVYGIGKLVSFTSSVLYPGNAQFPTHCVGNPPHHNGTRKWHMKVPTRSCDSATSFAKLALTSASITVADIWRKSTRTASLIAFANKESASSSKSQSPYSTKTALLLATTSPICSSKAYSSSNSKPANQSPMSISPKFSATCEPRESNTACSSTSEPPNMKSRNTFCQIARGVFAANEHKGHKSKNERLTTQNLFRFRVLNLLRSLCSFAANPFFGEPA